MAKARDFFDLNSELSLSAGHDRTVVFASRESGELAHISEVDNGKACGCFCLACHEALIARQGAVREHSFAHQSGTQCQHAMETMLHGVVYRLVARHRYFVVPELVVTSSIPGPHGLLADTRIRPAIKVIVENLALVERPPWGHPCVEATVKGHSVLIHVAVKNPTSRTKLEALTRARQAAIEIDLSGRSPRTVGDMARLLLEADARKTWLFNPKAEAIAADIRMALQPEADRQRAAHEAAKARQRELQLERAQAMARDQAEYQRLLDAKRAAALAKEAGDEAERTQKDVTAVRQHVAPAELSPAVEYVAPTGRLWLLHSAHSDIFVRVEPELESAKEVIRRFGAEPLTEPGVWRITPAGWSRASIELSKSWTRVRTVAPAP